MLTNVSLCLSEAPSVPQICAFASTLLDSAQNQMDNE